MKDEAWHIINSLLAGGLVFVGAFADGTVTVTGIIAALSASCVVALSKFKDYWQNSKTSKFFNFI